MQKVILLMGPTAAGKTDLAIEIAQKKPVSIISVDSVLIYRDMNIGTAKPDDKILANYPHALVDIISPEQKYSVQNFMLDAKRQIAHAFAENKTPLLVGGTAFYFNALQHGLSDLPESTKESRAYVNHLLQDKNSVYLHLKLQKIDKISSEKIHKNDSQRIMRALEVYYLTNKTLSSLQGNKTGYLSHSLSKIVLMPIRNILHQRIKARFLIMLERGFLAEMEFLRNKYNLNSNMPSMRSVGYRQAWQYLENEINKEEMITKSIIATRQLCKRQSTWFNHEKNALFIDNIDIKKVMNYV